MIDRITQILYKDARLNKLADNFLESNVDITNKVIDTVNNLPINVNKFSFPLLASLEHKVENLIDKEMNDIENNKLKGDIKDMVDKVKKSNSTFIKNLFFLVGILVLIRLIVNKFANTPKEYISNNDYEIDKVKSKDFKTEINNYFKKLENYLDGFFLRKYFLSLMTLSLDDIESLKEKYVDINCTEVLFPVSYSERYNSSEIKAVLLKIAEDLNLKINESENEQIIEEIKNYYKQKSHDKIINEFKEYISSDDQDKLDQLANLEPIAIIN